MLNNTFMVQPNLVKNDIRQQSDISVTSFNKKYRINSSQILFIKSDSNYSTIFYMTHQLQKVFTSRTLKHWHTKFDSDKLIKIHNSYLINKDKIMCINRSNKTVQIQEEIEIPYSRGCSKVVNALMA